MHVAVQRSLQGGEVQRVGSDQAVRVDVRLVTAINRDLAQEVAHGRVRGPRSCAVFAAHCPGALRVRESVDRRCHGGVRGDGAGHAFTE